MRKFLALTVVATVGVPLAANAGVSDDLVFCSQLSNKNERIACYDAAARIAGAKQVATQTRAVPSQVGVAVAAPMKAKSPTWPARTKFDGMYAALGGSYGISTTRSLSVSSPSGFNSFFASLAPQGISGRGAVGYNMTIGDFLLGIEGEGRWGNELAKASNASTVRELSVGCCVSGPFGQSSQALSTASDMSAHLSLRAGATFGDTLIFAKLGAGATRIVDKFEFDGRGLFDCAQLPTVSGCGDRLFFGQGTISSPHWLPSALMGVGVEHNFGSFFARLSGDVEWIGSQSFPASAYLSPGRRVSASGIDLGAISPGRFFGNGSSDTFWSARAAAMIGLRF